MRSKKLDHEDVEHLTDLIFDSKLSLSDIAKEFDLCLKDLNTELSKLNLSWVKSSRKKMSRGQTALTSIMKKLFPGEIVLNEHHVGDRLRLDVFCPKYKIAAEYHGRQHFFYTERFFESRYDFLEAQKRDEKKAQICKELGIELVTFRYNDELTEEAVYNRMLAAIRGSSFEKKDNPKKSLSNSDFYQEQKRRRSAYNKQAYKKLKDSRSKNDRE
jgi:very-short-patch-repair endonuclease